LDIWAVIATAVLATGPASQSLKARSRMESFEKLGAFYLGRPCDPETLAPQEGYLLYDAKDLTTHAVCVGMTGSGKTGLGISLLEEAALDQVPAIIIDPKGDMANLLLTFPDLAAEDFLPWVQEADATRQGQTVEAYAENQAGFWRQGLQDWGQDGERIRQLRQAAEFALYTPGSTAATPVSILKSFAAPSPAILADDELLREQAAGTAASLLGLLGLDADPVKSRDHILLTTILLQDWQQGRDLDLAGLIARIQTPPFSQMGILPLDAFYPAQDRLTLALQFNNLLASPSFAGWLQGEPLDLDRILYTASGKSRLAIFSIAHLSETERQFFVTLLLNQTISWMRRQSGSSSLRAILYMDEIYGYFPPVANPPAKAPLLTLLKQARAYGLGVVLTTQNPVDLITKVCPIPGPGSLAGCRLSAINSGCSKDSKVLRLPKAKSLTGPGWNRFFPVSVTGPFCCTMSMMMSPSCSRPAGRCPTFVVR